MSVRYRLGVSGFAVDYGDRHDWRPLAALAVRHYEFCMLEAGELERARSDLSPASFGVHWPLWRKQPAELRLVSRPLAAVASTAAEAVDQAAAAGARYLLAHFPGRGESWPTDGSAAIRVAMLRRAASGRLTLVLEPKEPLAEGGGLSAFARRAPDLGDGVALCVDTNDMLTALRHDGAAGSGSTLDRLAGRAEYFHLHAMHLLPGRGGRYYHAPPWVSIDGVPDADLLQIDAHALDTLAVRGRTVTVQIEVPPRYLDALPASLDAVRRRLAGLGWQEEEGAGTAGGEGLPAGA